MTDELFPRSSPRVLWVIATISVVILAAVLAVVFFNWLPTAQFDDSYITYRYSWNLVSGNGLVFNVDERVNSASSLLYTLLMATVALLGHDSIPLGSLVLGAAALVMTGVVMVIAARELRRDALGLSVGTVAASVVVLNATNLYWSMSGMETATFNFLLAAALLLATGPVRSLNLSRSTALAALLVALCLCRPEGILVAITLAIGWAVRSFVQGSRRRLRAAALPLVASMVTAIGYAAFNAAYYGSVVPNSVRFKTVSRYYTATVAENAISTLEYLAIRLGPIVVVGAVAGLIAAIRYSNSRRDTLLRLMPGAAATVAFCIFLGVASNSDQFRYATPLSVLVAWMVLQAAGADRIGISSQDKKWIAAITIGFVALSVVWQAVVAGRIRASTEPFLRVQQAREDMGQWLEATTQPGSRVLSGDLGALAFWNPSNHYVDSSGLTNARLLDDLVAGVPYARSITDQLPDLLVDTVDPRGQAGSIQTFDNPNGYFEEGLVSLSPQRFEESYEVESLMTVPSPLDGQFGVEAWRLTLRQ